jgi:hypothetical protein
MSTDKNAADGYRPEPFSRVVGTLEVCLQRLCLEDIFLCFAVHR